MNIGRYCRLVSATCLRSRPWIKWTPASAPTERWCLAVTARASVHHKADPTGNVSDIKRRVMRRLGEETETMANRYGKEVVVYECSRASFYRAVAVGGLFAFLTMVVFANVLLFWYIQTYQPQLVAHNRRVGNDQTLSARQKLAAVYDACKLYILTSGAAVIIGHAVLIWALVRLTRSVTCITVRLTPAGTDTVTIYCYSMLGTITNYHKHQYPLNHVSALRPRINNNKSTAIPVRAMGRLLPFHVDSRGTFLDPTLFDETVGVFRKF